MADFRYVIKHGRVTEYSQRFKESSLTAMLEILKERLKRINEDSYGRIEEYTPKGTTLLQYKLEYTPKPE